MFERIRSTRGFVGISIILITSIVVTSCATTSPSGTGKGSKYQYSFRMTSPTQNTNLLYQDQFISIQFKFDEAAVGFQLQNVASSDCELDWTRTTLGINGRFFPVRHSSNLYGDSTKTLSKSFVPSMGYIQDLVIPRDNIHVENRHWREIDLFPTVDNDSEPLRKTILQSVGRTVSLILPLTFGTESKRYDFEFQVSSVDKIPWKNYKPVKRVPPPPQTPVGGQGLDEVTTAILAVGILGFAAYLITLKKNPASE